MKHNDLEVSAKVDGLIETVVLEDVEKKKIALTELARRVAQIRDELGLADRVLREAIVAAEVGTYTVGYRVDSDRASVTFHTQTRGAVVVALPRKYQD